MNLPKYELITSKDEWRACFEILRGEPCMGVDLEANSLYAYREKICLIQISVPGHDFILDPLAGFNFDEFGDLLADPGMEKVFHASDYDLTLLRGGYGWGVERLFDTMWAARILGHTKMGLAGFLSDLYGISLVKRHQKADWAARPLSASQLAYAQMDTHYLLRLREEMAAQLDTQGLLTEAFEIFSNACRVPPLDRTFDPEGFWSLPGARRLNGQGLAILRALYAFREREARRRDTPVFKVLSNELLVKLAEAAPQDAESLLRIDGLSRKLADRMGERIAQVIAKGAAAKRPTPPVRAPRDDSGVLGRYKTLYAWRRETALKRRVESDVIMTRETMWDIATRNPSCLEDLETVDTLGPCRLAMYGEEVLRALGETP